MTVKASVHLYIAVTTLEIEAAKIIQNWQLEQTYSTCFVLYILIFMKEQEGQSIANDI